MSSALLKLHQISRKTSPSSHSWFPNFVTAKGEKERASSSGQAQTKKRILHPAPAFVHALGARAGPQTHQRRKLSRRGEYPCCRQQGSPNSLTNGAAKRRSKNRRRVASVECGANTRAGFQPIALHHFHTNTPPPTHTQVYC